MSIWGVSRYRDIAQSIVDTIDDFFCLLVLASTSFPDLLGVERVFAGDVEHVE